MRYLLLVLLLFGCTIEARTESLMDTYATISHYGATEAAVNDAFYEIARVENEFSIYKDTPVKRLNDEKYINASDEVISLIEKSVYYSRLSDGAFDITVQPLLDLYSISFEELHRPPKDHEIEQMLKNVGYELITLDGNEVCLDNTSITMGGIAKGYAIDRAAEVLIENGVKSALINIGGDIRVIGSKPTGKWKIALENPRGDGVIDVFYLSDYSIATSGDYRRYFDESLKAHHIMDPKTGKSATDLISVTVIAPDAVDADALATSVFVMGEDGMLLIDSIDGVEGLIITRDRRILKSKNINKFR